MEIVRADPRDANELTQLAIAAKQYWGYPDEWMAKWRSLLSMSPEYLSRNEVYVARIENEIAGFYALTGTGQTLVLDHLWVKPQHIGTGIGRALVTHAIQRAAALGADTVELEADPHAVGFYQRMGAQYRGETQSSLERALPILAFEISRQS
jgi:ribosomal protein S18 acetylase RimI-like enzyme